MVLSRDGRAGAPDNESMTVLSEGQLDEQRAGTALAVILTYVDFDPLPKDLKTPQVTSVLCCTALSRPAPEPRLHLISPACIAGAIIREAEMLLTPEVVKSYS